MVFVQKEFASVRLYFSNAKEQQPRVLCICFFSAPRGLQMILPSQPRVFFSRWKKVCTEETRKPVTSSITKKEDWLSLECDMAKVAVGTFR